MNLRSVSRTLAAVTSATLLVPLIACSSGASSPAAEATNAAATKPGDGAASSGDVPKFQYDPSFPKLPLPHEWILGEVVFAGQRLCRCEVQIHSREVVDGFRIPIGNIKGKAGRVAVGQADLRGVIARV